MQLEFQQLELRYDRLRIARPDHERRLLSSLAEVGQQVPIVVVKDGHDEHFVVIDGYKRVRSLRRLGRDTVGSFCWECSEAEALVVSRLWHTGESETALEQSGCSWNSTSDSNCPRKSWPVGSLARSVGSAGAWPWCANRRNR